MPPVPTNEALDRQLKALAILENREQLVWHSNHRNESIAQTTLHFEKIFYGVSSSVKPLFVDAVAGERLPESAARSLLLDSARKTLDATGASSPRSGSEGEHAASPSPSASRGYLREDRQTPSDRPKPVAVAGERDLAEGNLRPPGSSPGSGRKGRAEQSSGASQASGSKKRARKSLGNS